MLHSLNDWHGWYLMSAFQTALYVCARSEETVNSRGGLDAETLEKLTLGKTYHFCLG